MDANCGPLHDGCNCVGECPECGGIIEETTDFHICDCDFCHRQDEDIDVLKCLNERCEWKGEKGDENRVGAFLKVTETKKLAEWIEWARAS